MSFNYYFELPLAICFIQFGIKQIFFSFFFFSPCLSHSFSLLLFHFFARSTAQFVRLEWNAWIPLDAHIQMKLWLKLCHSPRNAGQVVSLSISHSPPLSLYLFLAVVVLFYSRDINTINNYYNCGQINHAIFAV